MSARNSRAAKAARRAERQAKVRQMPGRKLLGPVQPILARLTTPVSGRCCRCRGWIDAGFGRAPYAVTPIGPCCLSCVFDPLAVAS